MGTPPRHLSAQKGQRRTTHASGAQRTASATSTRNTDWRSARVARWTNTPAVYCTRSGSHHRFARRACVLSVVEIWYDPITCPPMNTPNPGPTPLTPSGPYAFGSGAQAASRPRLRRPFALFPGARSPSWSARGRLVSHHCSLISVIHNCRRLGSESAAASENFLFLYQKYFRLYLVSLSVWALRG